ncbi:hypothetical protein CTI12_AA060960 [Artemisia annua]|uniref:Uncharacterized protein n=1 Tax=Artemisia annua TaxID=35608 RepID=A0A2U1Q840_ARTAN|nr:hypothetical protein CTI12_AA060960 [Artemisia annua]
MVCLTHLVSKKHGCYRPNIDHLKELCGSNQLQHCFKYLFVQEWRENENFIRYIGDKCANLEASIKRRAQLMQEGESFGPFHDVAPDAVECMAETQEREQDMLAALMGVLDLAREGRTEKEHHVGLMDLKG